MLQQENKLQAGVSTYHKAKAEGDIDLVVVVRNILLNAGLAEKVVTAYDGNRFIIEAYGKDSEVQRFLLNRYWNQQLMMGKRVSIEERYCLIPNGTIDDWLKLFNAKVLPFLLDNNLPVVIS